MYYFQENKKNVGNNKLMSRPEDATETATFYKGIISLRIVSMPTVCNRSPSIPLATSEEIRTSLHF